MINYFHKKKNHFTNFSLINYGLVFIPNWFSNLIFFFNTGSLSFFLNKTEYFEEFSVIGLVKDNVNV